MGVTLHGPYILRWASEGRMHVAITFPATETWNGNREVVSFLANVDNRRARCAISWEALENNFGGNNSPPLDAFRANRGAIEALAERLLIRRRLEQDGSLLIRTRDC